MVRDQSFGWIGEVPVEVRLACSHASVGLGSSGMGSHTCPKTNCIELEVSDEDAGQHHPEALLHEIGHFLSWEVGMLVS